MANSSTTFKRGHEPFKAMLGVVGEKHPSWKGGKKKCPTCGTTINYTSKSCNKHKIFSEQHRKNIGLKSLSRPSANKGKIFSVEYRKKIGESRVYPRGKDHPNWKGGETKKDYGGGFTKNIKQIVKERDNFTCQICHRKGETLRLDVHHVDYDKKNNIVQNLRTLCHRCHATTNFNRERWITFFSD